MTLIESAKQFMASYISEVGICRPSDFDEDILGQHQDIALGEILNGREPAWNKTIFCKALGELVKEGKVEAQDDEQLGWFYKIKS